MKAKIVFPALVLSMPLWGAPPAAEVDPETIRGAVERSLPLLEKTGPIFFEKGRLHFLPQPVSARHGDAAGARQRLFRR